MTLGNRISAASLFFTLAGGVFLSAPARASAAETPCRDSVEAYCQWVADNFCAHGATCWYTNEPCQIVDSECW